MVATSTSTFDNTYYYGGISIPIERNAADSTLSVELDVTGDNGGGFQQVCAKVYSFDEDGIQVGASTNPCTSTSSPIAATFSWSGLTLDSGGGVFIHVAAQAGGRIKLAKYTWEAVGS